MTPAHNEPYTLPLIESNRLTVTITHVFDRFAFMVRMSAMGCLQALSLQYHSPISYFIGPIGPEIDYPDIELV